MTGLPEMNFPAFMAAEEVLRGAGYEVRNPARNGQGDGLAWEDYVRRDLRDLLDCHAVALLPDWENSRGATLEVYVAKNLLMDVRPLEEWI
jgi:hypothetical protein